MKPPLRTSPASIVTLPKCRSFSARRNGNPPNDTSTEPLTPRRDERASAARFCTRSLAPKSIATPSTTITISTRVSRFMAADDTRPERGPRKV
jgi:hypothetical protein